MPFFLCLCRVGPFEGHVRLYILPLDESDAPGQRTKPILLTALSKKKSCSRRQAGNDTRPGAQRRNKESTKVKELLIRKMEDLLAAYREETEKHEGSTLSTVGKNAKAGLEKVKAGIKGNATAQKAFEKFGAAMETFEEALKKGDRRVTAGSLHMMEKFVKELKEKGKEGPDGKPGETPENKPGDKSGDTPEK